MIFKNKTDSEQARIKFQIHFYDMMGSYPAAWEVAVRSDTIIGPKDVSPELAAFVRKIEYHPHDSDRARDLFWREATKEQS